MSRKRTIFCVSSITRNAIDCTILAHLELSALTLLAGSIVSSVPWATDAVASLPSLLAFADSYDVADDLVTGDDGEGVAKCSGLDS